MAAVSQEKIMQRKNLHFEMEDNRACIDLPEGIDIARISIGRKRVELIREQDDVQVSVMDLSGTPLYAGKQAA
jgi:hypothetical protein